MAYVSGIWIHESDINKKQDEITVYINLKPAGKVQLVTKIPENFYQALLNIAQTAADAHEAQMRAEIIGDTITEPTKERP